MWVARELHVDPLQSISGAYVDSPWGVDGDRAQSVDSRKVVRGQSMDSPWGVHGQSVRGQSWTDCEVSIEWCI